MDEQGQKISSGDEGGLFGPAAEAGAMTITAVRELVGTPKRVSVLVGRRRVATLLAPQALELGLAAGCVWTEAIAARVARMERVNSAKAIAMRRLSARARSRAEMRAWLVAKGVEAQVADEAIERLVEVGLVSDEDVVAQEAKRGEAKGLSRLLIAERMRMRGVDPGENDAGVGDRDRAIGIVREELSRRGTGPVDVNAMARRMFGMLARKGYDEDVAREAVEQVLTERGLRVGEAE